jgi:hypothetical protein
VLSVVSVPPWSAGFSRGCEHVVVAAVRSVAPGSVGQDDVAPARFGRNTIPAASASIPARYRVSGSDRTAFRAQKLSSSITSRLRGRPSARIRGASARAASGSGVAPISGSRAAATTTGSDGRPVWARCARCRPYRPRADSSRRPAPPRCPPDVLAARLGAAAGTGAIRGAALVDAGWFDGAEAAGVGARDPVGRPVRTCAPPHRERSMRNDARKMLTAVVLMTLAPAASAADIVVTRDRPTECDLDIWCTSGTYEDVLAMTTPSGIDLYGDWMGDVVGDGGGNEIVVTADREAKEEENKEQECAEQASNSRFLNAGGVPSSPVILHGEIHDELDVSNDPAEAANRQRQEALIRRAQSDGSRVCVGIEFGRGMEPGSSQQDMYAFADANGIPSFNVDPTQVAGATSTQCNNSVYDPASSQYNEQQATDCLNARDQGMALGVAHALAYGINGRCDRVVVIVGDGHTSQTVSSEKVSTNPYLRYTLVDYLQALGIDPFVDNPDMLAQFCQE